TMRVDPGGTRNIDIRTYGRNQIEVTIPRANPLEVRRIREKISSAGSLEFRILADRHDPRSTHKTLIAQAAETDAEVIMNTDGSETLGWWVRVAPGEEASFADDPNVVTRKANYRGKQVLEVLVLNDPYNVTGDRLSFCTASYDDKGQPCVKFNFDRAGGNRFGQFTGENKPLEEGAQELFRKLGIILNDELFSAPQLRSQIFGEGEITGRFTQEEVDDLVDVLNAGSLPTALKPNPLFEQESGPSLGRDMIRRGAIATGLSLLAVVFCMTFYYRFAGVVASAAVVMNLLMLLAVMDVIKGFDLTLPGIAGLVLSVGMAVDANVLIFERMREELTRGATLRMAIRNGFDRAMSVIIDSNLTGLITAVILYAIGTSQIRGFAATLGLGIVFSLFTAVFCSHVVFDVGERRGWIKKLSMRNWVKPTQFDFMGRLSTFGVGLSLTLLVIGLFAVVGRGKGLLDIDFTGGESVQILFQKPQRIDNVRRTLLDARNADGSEVFPDLMVWDTNIHGEASGMRFIVNTSKTVDDAAAQKKSAVKIVEEDLANLFKGELATNQLSFGKIQAIELETPEAAPPAATPAAPPADETTKPAANEQSRNDLPPSSLVTSTDPSVVLLAQAEPADQPPPAAAPAEGVMETAPVRDRFAGGSRVDLNFELALDHDTVKELVGSQLAKVGLGAVAFELRNDHYAPGDSNAYENWTLRIQLPEDELKEKVIEPIDEQLAATPYFPSSSSIGGKVAGDMQEKAIIAILLSLLCVVAYLWVRFQHISYGLATVLALVHDVLITLGAVAVTAYIYPVVDTMKIGLTVLAAFLTIIGYSLNDTIVVFDRIREVKGKLPYLNKTTINASINQTLSRTLLTGMTTLFVLIILFYGGGSGLHAFAYTLLIGIITGTYSSVFVATPLLYWMTGRGKAQGASKAA
ncbi:MAG TPA: protein translocase subunit SecD, partial [Thermoguttaceae bacterium]|nr:protein translocase subunit SecD [Thermoguttaceae bacterium]